MSLQGNNAKELQKKGEVDSISWQTYALENLVALESEIQDMVQQKGKLSNQLLKMADVILKTSSSINSLKNHRKDFERLLAEASTLFVIFCQLYIEAKAKYPSLRWPPPKLRNLLDELVDMACRIHKFFGRKSEKNPVKRVVLGCFGIHDFGKSNIYQRRLGIMALCLQSKPHNINIHAVLLAVVHSRAQPQDENSDSEPAGDLVEGELTDKKSAKKKAADKKPTAEVSRLCEVGRSATSVKIANQRVKSEEDSQRKSSNAKNKAKDNPKYERDEERSAEDKPPRRIDRRTNGNGEARENQDRDKTIRYEPDRADLVQRTSVQGSRSGNTAYSKTRKKPDQAYEDGENIRGRTLKRKSRSQTNPVTPQTQGPLPRHQVSFPFTNESGIMVNENIGNTYNITTSG